MFPLLALLALGLVIYEVSKGKGTPNEPVVTDPQNMTVGHVYDVVFRSSSLRRSGASADQLAGLQSTLVSLGWSADPAPLLMPNDADADPNTWRAEAYWAGPATILGNGNGLTFIGVTDVTPDPSAHHQWDADLPPNLELAVSRALQYETDAIQLVTFADSLSPQFPIASGALLSRAAVLNVQPVTPPSPGPDVPPGPTPQPPAPTPQPPAPTPAPVTPDVPPGTQPTWASAVGDWPNGMNTISAPAWSHVPDANAMSDIQAALNTWATTVQYPDPRGIFPLATDGQYGPNTASGSLAFQHWENVIDGAALAEDGIPGDATAALLVQYGDLRGS